MKKRVFCFIMAAMLMPFAVKAQNNAGVHIDATVDTCATSYEWIVAGDSTTYTTSGVYFKIKGDTLYILDLSLRQSYATTESVAGGCSYRFGDTTISNPGTYTRLFKSQYGCDSMATINLTLGSTATKEYTVSSCEYYVWKNDTLRTDGTYTKTETANGCDSNLTLNLTVITPTQKSFDTTLVGCDTLYYRFEAGANPFMITRDGFDTTSDAYSRRTAAARRAFHPRTATACYDSISRIHFNVKKSQWSTMSPVACDKYSITVNDTMNRTYEFSINDTLKVRKGSANGCDSMIAMRITINPSPVVVIGGDLRVAPGQGATLTVSSNQENTSFLWSNGSTSESITLDAVNGNTDISVTGTNNTTNCASTTTVTVMANAGIETAADKMVQVYPNPTKGHVNVTSEEEINGVEIYNIYGQLVKSYKGNEDINLSGMASGKYILRVELNNGSVALKNVVLTK